MMGPFVEKALSPYVPIAKTKGVRLHMDFSAGFCADISVNAMEKALSNIISNAVKYTKSSGRVNVYLNNRNNLY